MGTINQKLLFYKIMGYPIPTQKDFFLFGEKNKAEDIKKTQYIKNFSRDNKNQFIDKFIDKINKYGNIYKSIPFVQEIFLCNSITFNALKRDSDIDLFIITKKNSIWRARLFSVIFFKLLGIKRSIKNKKQKFCLSFYVTQDNTNLYQLMIDKTDIYLTYRLSHLVLLYQESLQYNNIYQDNKRFKSLMPYHPQEHCINIGNKLFIGKTKTKKNFEFLFGGIIGNIFEIIIKILRTPILIYKIKKIGDSGKHIIINDKILKFHKDIREKINLLYKIAQKK